MKIRPHTGNHREIKIGIIIGYSPAQEDDDIATHGFLTFIFLWWFLAFTIEKE